ncbi:MAG: AMP-binding protein [Thermoguttaceae bacterium]|nr:AMP-binding protein [Thermoguttaceae bacterium]
MNEYNIAERLTEMAKMRPRQVAIAEPLFAGKRPLRDKNGKRKYKTISFEELDRDSNHIAAALQKFGVQKGVRLALMVRQGIDFISLVFALYKTGATLVLIDPGMGVRRMLACLRDAQLDGFVGIPQAQIARILYSRWFPKAKYNLTVGKRLFWGGLSLDAIRKTPYETPSDPHTTLEDPAAIIFTSGSTGVAKGVLYTYRMFKTQVEQIAERLDIKPGGIDLVGFPFFGLFNAGMGTTAVIPDMDTTRPGAVDPVLFLEAADDWKITQSFGSPALWNRVVDYCLAHNRTIPTLKRAVIAGAPVSFELLAKFRRILPDDAEIITPYGATESLPLAAIESREVLGETAARTKLGEGVCVGCFFPPPLKTRIIPVTDAPIEQLEDLPVVPQGEIGELLVSGPQASPGYVTRVEANVLSLVRDQSGQVWRRVGDVGWIDDLNRFWFCGRKSHRVETPNGPLFSIPCEAIANRSDKVFRSALAGAALPDDFQAPKEEELSERARQFRSAWRLPVIVVEPYQETRPKNERERQQLIDEVLELLRQSPLTQSITKVLICESFPVDVRHNAKINRELLSEWATARLAGKTIPLENAPVKG